MKKEPVDAKGEPVEMNREPVDTVGESLRGEGNGDSVVF
jgi:hypothetical protein